MKKVDCGVGDFASLELVCLQCFDTVILVICKA